MRYIDYIKEKVANKKVCIYPMGIAGKAMLTKLENYGIEIDYFSDRNSELWGSEFKGKPCIPKPQLVEMCQENLLIIIESLYYKEIKKELQESGIKNIIRVYPERFATDSYLEKYGDTFEKRVDEVLSVCEDEKSKQIFKYLTDFWKSDNCSDNYFEAVYEKNQYFDNEIVQVDESTVFVDAGAYIGDTAEKYIEMYGNCFEKMHLFELDPDIYTRLQENVGKMVSETEASKIVCYPYGLSDMNGTVKFMGGDSSSSISDGNGNSQGVVKRLDDILENERVTFIKMDIEGAEQSALRGAEKIIKSQKPTLAICIYHSPEDMLEIPVYIKSLVPEYKIYIRHYTDLMLETVCYAIPDTK